MRPYLILGEACCVGAVGYFASEGYEAAMWVFSFIGFVLMMAARDQA